MSDFFKVSVEPGSVSLVLNNIERAKEVLLSEGVVKAMEDWAKLVQQIARENVPVLTGNLRDSINWLIVEVTKDMVLAKVSLMDEQGNQLPYAWATEVGGIIRAAPGSFLHWIDSGTGQDAFAKQVYHPPQPFLYPALVASMEKGQELITNAINDAISKI